MLTHDATAIRATAHQQALRHEAAVERSLRAARQEQDVITVTRRSLWKDEPSRLVGRLTAAMQAVKMSLWF